MIPVIPAQGSSIFRAGVGRLRYHARRLPPSLDESRRISSIEMKPFIHRQEKTPTARVAPKGCAGGRRQARP
jgi:hypothetical protein